MQSRSTSYLQIRCHDYILNVQEMYLTHCQKVLYSEISRGRHSTECLIYSSAAFRWSRKQSFAWVETEPEDILDWGKNNLAVERTKKLSWERGVDIMVCFNPWSEEVRMVVNNCQLLATFGPAFDVKSRKRKATENIVNVDVWPSRKDQNWLEIHKRIWCNEHGMFPSTR